MLNNLTSKKEIRSLLLQERIVFAASKEFAEANRKIQNKLGNLLKEILPLSDSMVGLYLPFKSEVKVMAVKLDYQICLPWIEQDKQNKQIIFRIIDSFKDFKTEKMPYGKEAKQVSEIYPLVELNQIDSIVVPIVGFNEDLKRLGYGGGYYDQTLENYMGVKIGIAFEFQRADFSADSHDISMNYIVTEERIYGRDCE